MAGRGDTCEAGGACGGSLGWDGGLESPLANAFFTFITGRPPKIDVSSDDVLSVTVGFSVVLLWLSSFGDPIQPTTLPPLPPKLTNPIQFPVHKIDQMGKSVKIRYLTLNEFTISWELII